MQFHPTCLFTGERSFLISEALRGAGATLEHRDGERFMAKYDQKELAPRDIVARSIDFEMKHGIEHVYLNATLLDKDYIIEHFPTIHGKCKRLGIDITKIDSDTRAHYSCGGF